MVMCWYMKWKSNTNKEKQPTKVDEYGELYVQTQRVKPSYELVHDLAIILKSGWIRNNKKFETKISDLGLLAKNVSRVRTKELQITCNDLYIYNEGEQTKIQIYLNEWIWENDEGSCKSI